jgi:acyl-CoA reductase-like NAD-dependent aldehyde dehydrogenase
LPGEIFGPVAIATRWHDYEDMLRQANGTPYRSRRGDLDP